MFVENDVKCFSCRKVFCCSNCRIKHENNYHKNVLKCLICLNQKIVYNSNIDANLLTHIAEKHLPLHCVKCFKVYTNSNDIDLDKFSKCLKTMEHHNNNPIIEIEETKFEEINLTSPALTPTLPALTSPELTPTSPALTPNIITKKSQQTFDNLNSESSPGLKRVSFVQPKTENKPKAILVRSTSTPMNSVFCFKQKETEFNGSAGHVSSIYGSGSDSDASPPIINILTPTVEAEKNIQRISKFHNEKKLYNKQVTPLQQVMSKSIRRAITEHGMEKFNYDQMKRKETLTFCVSPLDLRTSPALRRVQSEIVERSCSFENFDSSKTSTRKNFSVSKTTESILIKSTINTSSISNNKMDKPKYNTIFTTCSSIEVIRSTELKKINANNDSDHFKLSKNSISYTPQAGGIMKKKTIDFKTPNKNKFELSTDDDDIFYTPQSKTSYDTILDHDKYLDIKDVSTNSNISNNNNNNNKLKVNKEGRGQRLWSMLSSLWRIPSFSNHNNNNQQQENMKNDSLEEKNGIQTLKRKRECSDLNLFSYQSNRTNNESPAKRTRAIRGRKPIDRMRNLSIDYLN